MRMGLGAAGEVVRRDLSAVAARATCREPDGAGRALSLHHNALHHNRRRRDRAPMADTVIGDDWTPAHWSYGAVMDMQARLDPIRMARYAEDWHRAIDRIEEVLVQLSNRVGAHIERSWRGHGADSALESVRRYVEGSLSGLASCRSVAVHLSE